MTQRPDTIQPWPEGGLEAFRCRSCGKAWVIDRDPDVDNEELMVERMSDHFCFPGITIEEVNGVWRAAHELAGSLPARSVDRHSPADETTAEEQQAFIEEFERESAAGEELAMRFDCNVALLDMATVARYGSEVWTAIIRSAAHGAARAAQSDESRARKLARSASFGIPGATDCYKPVHARMALDYLDEEYVRAQSSPGWEPRATIDEARGWLEHFAGHANALL